MAKQKQVKTLIEALQADVVKIIWPDFIGKKEPTELRKQGVAVYIGHVPESFWANDEITLIHAALAIPGCRVLIDRDGVDLEGLG